ncbi:nitroreductase family protein [Sedimenticola selenatireducens]|uniref:Nitroreductase family protein n=1 Tax=Sedimenticola selenatireducens TaxID=191960 RepID=A0A557RUL4_9GAMM|nr:nitroreductase family protein [Sedimenticola selenatireducens]TVO68855.1 nitroreductase family protein [Sedimenticola selenatireducens]TVT61227.1 MAG: nitroreductase family protein [Sedimenticola selenatireducens]
MSEGDHRHIPLSQYQALPLPEMQQRAEQFFDLMRRRRSVRAFSERPVDRSIIEKCLLTAGRAPSGANQQPWKFVVVSNPELKRTIRLAAEEEEREFYAGGASEEWLDALKPLATDAEKPFLDHAPYLIVIFSENYGVDDEGNKIKHYYVRDSVGIATGILITAIHNAGLASLTHTPSPMRFLNQILDRPKNETPTMILVVGYPEEGVTVPDIDKKGLDEIAVFKS